MALADLDLNLLVVLDALLEEQSVTRAARRVGLSQPALSNALARLRAQLGDPLFVRAGRGIVPTARAAELAPVLRAALRSIEAALQEGSFEPATSRRRFRIMTSDYMEAVLFPALLLRLGEEAPFVDVELRPPPATTAAPREALERGEIDLALGVRVDDGAGLTGVTLFSDTFVGLARRAHPLFSGKLSVEHWAELPHVLIAPRGGRVGYVDDALAELGLSRRIHVLTPHFATAPRLLVDTDLVLTLPARAARLFAEAWKLRSFEPPVPLPAMTFGLHWHERHARDVGHRWLRRLIADTGRALGAAAA